MASRKSKKTAPLTSQPDPKAPVDSKLLLQHLVPALKALEKDLLQRADGSPQVTEALQKRWEAECSEERTADSFEVWRRGIVTQVAAAWVLSCVFVRILEDRGLLTQNRIAGPGAEGSQQEFMKLAPFLTERDYLLLVFRELCHFEATRELFDQEHNLVWRLAPSAEGVKALLALFRQGGSETPAFRFGQADTRFLGDLYQDLSEDVRKKYALLQTPDFVEEFILDRTLDTALETFGIDATTLLDPTCGSGHFLLGAFQRLYERQLAERPNLSPREAAERALQRVYGVDINRYAVTISKFRLVLAFIEKGGYQKLEGTHRAPLQVATGDSLYHRVSESTSLPRRSPSNTAPHNLPNEAFALEETEKTILLLGIRHAAVVGNPPYITVKDKALNVAYRRLYKACHRSYSLAAPFAERFFDLCRIDGYTGMITANSFMKREFGKALIQDVLPQFDLQLVVNTSGAYIPGHGTPTVLLFGQRRQPNGSRIRAVLARRGEPSTPQVPAQGKVWSAIADHHHQIGFENDYVSVVETERELFSRHPWSLGGGGAAELKQLLEERCSARIGDCAELGTGAVTREDEVFNIGRGALSRARIDEVHRRAFLTGEVIRDWSVGDAPLALWPYNKATLEPEATLEIEKLLWPWKAQLSKRVAFGKSQVERGLPWTAYSMFFSSRMRTPLTITFAFVATHNHFVLDRGGKVFNRSAPIIKLPESATEDDHYALLAYLNSSTAAFYFRQCGHSKGAQGVNEGHKAEVWEQFLEYSGALVASLPVPRTDSLRALGKDIAALADKRTELAVSSNDPVHRLVAKERTILHQMCRIQELIDWQVYHAFELVSDAEFTRATTWLRRETVAPGARPFERILARRLEAGGHSAWFKRNDYARVENSPEETPIEKVIHTNRNLALLEQPEHKRRWGLWSWAEILKRRQRDAALLKVEGQLVEAQARSVGQLAPSGLSVEGESAPYLSALRYTATGLEKHVAWQHTWDLQRREDAGEEVTKIPVPPKYAQKDFRSPTYWRLRGKLDVPKERFISYPGCESDEDKSPVYGWAGWNHLQRAVALSGLYHQRREEGWEGERLLPMLVGLLELLPWLKQWHNEPDEELGGERPAAQFEAFVQAELQTLKKTPEEAQAAVLAWVEGGGGRAKKKAKKAGRKSKSETPVSTKKGLAKAKAGERAKGAA